MKSDRFIMPGMARTLSCLFVHHRSYLKGYSRDSPYFMELAGSLLLSHEQFTSHYPEPDQSGLRPHPTS